MSECLCGIPECFFTRKSKLQKWHLDWSSSRHLSGRPSSFKALSISSYTLPAAHPVLPWQSSSSPSPSSSVSPWLLHSVLPWRRIRRLKRKEKKKKGKKKRGKMERVAGRYLWSWMVRLKGHAYDLVLRFDKAGSYTSHNAVVSIISAVTSVCNKGFQL